MKITTKLWIGLVVLICLSPLGLLIPDHFKAGAAWGEWGAEEMEKLVGYIPKGLEKLSSLWSAPMPDYAFKGWEEKGMAHLSFAYIASAVVGIAIIFLAVFFLGKLLARKKE
ncbi:cobalamin biosynthesis protein [Candidatus Desantisbacteria bacterium CG_4_10_14_0_8_um_filter_48_22]|uniref:Cobalamin biosynthesis protein n=1 Tax=Candidatus Desantisbacteria bacterium CG_4_10_14_0_8_um_filter_48_22 TaxID=1974543 RepID=A0A2M7SBH3_9BACT|nr:MAG: cobalamin biosynthesis protein [Candidatus Desantisbacteria bacterium CG_4_10_14_0_8_um_filter_48_22]